MKAEIIKRQMIGVDEIEHPHNIAMKLIDQRLHEMNESLKHIKNVNANPDMTTQSAIDIISRKIKKLQYSKEILNLSGEALPDNYEQYHMNIEYKWAYKTRNRRKKVIVYDLYGNYVTTFDSINEASQALRVASSSISGVCLGKKSRAGNYRMKFLENEI